jgi:nitrite reductase/ring-hydroxylating ferredoxin subunit
MTGASLLPNLVAVCSSADVPEGGRLVYDVGDVTVGIFRVGGEIRAYKNTCPHQGGPVCQGMLIGAVDEQLDDGGATVGRDFDEADLRIVCPWHGFEFSIATGAHPANPRFSLQRFPAREEDGTIYVSL